MEGLLRLCVLLSCIALALGQVDCACDVALVLDVSGSIRTVDYPQVQTFATTIISSLEPKMNQGDKGARVGVIKFSNDATVVSQMSDQPGTLKSAVAAMKKTYGTTRTDLAIDAAVKMLTTNRPKDKCITMLVMTDGISNYPDDTQTSAAKARAAGINIVAVGVGPMVNITELNLMVTQPAQKNALKISEFAGLKQIAHTLYDKCSLPVQNTTAPIDFCECDIMLILDASGSISAQDWEHMLDFARTIIRGYANRLGIDRVRIGIITFSYRAVLRAPLSYDAVALLEVVDGLKKTTGTTNTTDALLKADEELYKHRRQLNTTKNKNAPGDNPACQAIRMVTDGRSNNPPDTAKAAYYVKETHNINTMAIGVGPLVDQTELKAIASEPHATNVIQLQQFSRLDQIAHDISDKCVKEPKKEPPLDYNKCHCDLVLIFDASGSIRAEDWVEVKNFANVVLENVKDSLGPKNTRIGIIHFHNRAELVLNLTSNYNEIKGAIGAMKKTQGTTRTWLALDMAHEEFVNFTNGLGKCRYMIVITDGASNNATKTQISAHRLKAKDLVQVQAVGVGIQATSFQIQDDLKRELQSISSPNAPPQYMTGPDSWKQLSAFAHKQFDTCKQVTPDPPPPPPTPEIKVDPCQCDVMIVMDASGSINAADWVKAKDYARIIVNGLSPFMAQNKTRVGVISFSSRATLEIPLTFDTHLAQGVINGLNKTTGTTRSDKALDLATRELWKYRKTDAGKNGCMSVQFVTDGNSNDPSKTAVAAHKLKQIAKVTAIGVGLLIKTEELATISTNSNYTKLENWNGLGAIAHQLTDQCLKRGGDVKATAIAVQDDCNCDMMLVFDASGSIWASHWVNVKQFSKTIVNGLSTHLASGSMRLGIVTFSNSAQLVSDLTSDKNALLNAIDGMQKTQGSTRTWKGLELAASTLMAKNKGLTSCKSIKVITDGNSNNKTMTIESANNIKRTTGATIMAVGVGQLVSDKSELDAVASSPSNKNVYFIDDFTGLEMIAHVISDKCKPKDEFNDCACDLVMVLDLSGSIAVADVDLVKGFAMTILKGMAPKLKSGAVRIGIVSFANSAKLEANITNSYTVLYNAIQGLVKTQGTTKTWLALQMAGKILVQNQRSAASCKSIKVVTDGQSTEPMQTAAAATYLKSQIAVTIMAIGVGPKVGIGELQIISSPPQAKNMKLLKDYKGLSDVAHLIADKCSGKYGWNSTCDMKNLMSCLTKTLPPNDCGEMDIYDRCASQYKCPDLLRIWCGMIFKGPSYTKCPQQTSVCAKALAAGYSKCDLGFYQECYQQMKMSKGADQCAQLNKYVWCAEAAVCGDLVNYLCIKGDHGKETGVVANGCKVTSCGHVKFQVDADTRRLVSGMAHANELNKSGFNPIVVALGVVVGVLAVGLVVVAVKYRRAVMDEELQQALCAEEEETM